MSESYHNGSLNCTQWVNQTERIKCEQKRKWKERQWSVSQMIGDQKNNQKCTITDVVDHIAFIGLDARVRACTVQHNCPQINQQYWTAKYLDRSFTYTVIINNLFPVSLPCPKNLMTSCISNTIIIQKHISSIKATLTWWLNSSTY